MDFEIWHECSFRKNIRILYFPFFLSAIVDVEGVESWNIFCQVSRKMHFLRKLIEFSVPQQRIAIFRRNHSFKQYI